MKKFILAILIFFFIKAAVNAGTIDCSFDTASWGYVPGEFYQCVVGNRQDFTEDHFTIDDVVGTHEDPKTNNDVTTFYLDNVPHLVHFPRNLEKFFKFLEVIAIISSNLQAITSDDLKPFPQLKAVNFDNNDLKVITADTFKFNPNLVQVDLDKNSIYHVEFGTFDGPSELKILSLSQNDKGCDLFNARSKGEVGMLIDKINSGKCFSVAYEVMKIKKQLEQHEVQLKQILRKIR
jgi:hypothetical protein